ncbi:hypothetical protein HGRIS_004996 [Hohenbuehelia grisea]|uniref:O-acyltransferase n=1 Tax=Hohenbuehelia grisea TaxID=104357 RepID=A0ABR3JEZ6_9AGAR
MPLNITAASAPVASRTTSGGFKTSEGTLYVSKPYRSKTSKKLRALITFAPRESTFDTNNARSSTNEFRGFFTLFWISMFLFTVRTYIRSMETNGYILNLRFASQFSRDAITLALSDAALVLSTSICVPFAKAISKGWIQYYPAGVIIQHTIQTLVLFTAIIWTFNRQWPWVQSGFLTLHSLVMVMKMHSYMTVNGELAYIHEQATHLMQKMRERTDALGGWEKAIDVAKSRRAEIDAKTGVVDSESEPEHTPNGTPPVPQGSTTSYVDPQTATTLRNRLAAVTGTTPKDSPLDSSVVDPRTHPLVDHPDEDLSAMAQDYSEMQTELTSGGPHPVTWPNNISLRHFADYQLVPTLVYELEYPRTERIRPLYLFEKTVATFGTFALLYTVTETFILPLTPTPDQSFFRSLLDLALPFMIAYLLLFFIIFECICNGFAELSHFADRQFYEDWVSHRYIILGILMADSLSQWNSTSWDEFSRKWNKPVHAFLLRHVYASTISTYKLSKTSALAVTFLLSACAHELVMAIVTQKFRFYLFALQLAQIPLIAISRIPMIKRNKLLGNIVFWLGLYAGFPLLCVAYCAY